MAPFLAGTHFELQVAKGPQRDKPLFLRSPYFQHNRTMGGLLFFCGGGEGPSPICPNGLGNGLRIGGHGDLPQLFKGEVQQRLVVVT